MSRLISASLLLLLIALARCDDNEKYPDKYDYINAAEILENDRLRTQYYNCFMSLGPCVTADQVFFKEFFPESIVTQCKKCTDKQKENLDLIVTWYTTNRPEEWERLVKKFIDEAEKSSQ